MLLIRIDQWEDDLIGHLVQNACNTQNQDGPRVAEHRREQLAVELPLNAEKVGQEEQRDEACTDQVDEEHVEHRRLAQHHEIEEVQRNVHRDEQLQRGKADGALLIAQIAEGDGLQGIEGHDDSHHQQVFVMVLIAERLADRSDETEDHQQENSCQRANGSHRRREYGVGLIALVVGKAEKGGLHTEGQQHEDERRIGIDIGAHTVVARLVRHIIGI